MILIVNACILCVYYNMRYKKNKSYWFCGDRRHSRMAFRMMFRIAVNSNCEEGKVQLILKKTRMTIILYILSLILLFAGGAALYYYQIYHAAAIFIPKEQREITGMLNRPGCGWYRLYAYYLNPGTSLPADKLSIFEEKDGYTYRLALLEFNLAEYNNQKLDTVALNNVEKVLQLFSNTKSKVIVRFLYDWDGLSVPKEPTERSIIEQHMKQAGIILNKYKSLIYTTQGIFVGNWAEMHNSNYLSAEDMTALLACYASATDPSIYLAVRTPAQYRAIVQELEEHPEKYEEYDVSGSKLLERLGLFNDGMFGSVSDTGTYHEADVAVTLNDKLAARESELNFQNELCQTVPNGGEVVIDNPYNDGENAIKDLAKMHVSYLNRMYDEAVIQKWKESTYTGSEILYQNKSYYNYITDHMGARFVLKNFSFSQKPSKKQMAKGRLELENKGFSALYQKAVLTITMINTETKEETIVWDSETEKEGEAVVFLPGQESISIPFSISLSDYEKGVYTFTARLTDSESGELISFANDSFDEVTGGYVLGTASM